MIILHVDHREYRYSKGRLDEELFNQAFHLTKTLTSKHSIETRIIFEDKMPNGCSRNFTRLYQELVDANPNCEVWFLAGGDRAAFSQTFSDKGRCLVVGRDKHTSSSKYLCEDNDTHRIPEWKQYDFFNQNSEYKWLKNSFCVLFIRNIVSCN